MTEDNKEIIIIFPFDPTIVEDQASGNPATYLKFIKYILKKNRKVYLIGAKGSNNKFKNENFSFIPIVDKPNHWIYFSIKLMLKRPFLNLPRNGIIISPNMAYLLPFAIFKTNIIIFESVFEVFGALKKTENSFTYYFTRLIHRLTEPYIIKKLDLIIVSPRYKFYYKEKYPKIINKLYEMTHESIDTNLFVPMDLRALRTKKNIPTTEKIIVQIVSVNRKKRLELSIKSLNIVKKKFKDVKLYIIGPSHDKKYREFLEDMIKELNLNKNIMFFGEYPLKKIPEFINCSNLLINTSTAETGPIPPIEAFACGKPVVSTDVGLIPLLIKNKKVGRILPVDVSEKVFAENIIHFLNQENNKELINERRQIAEEFGIEKNQNLRLKACELSSKKNKKIKK